MTLKRNILLILIALSGTLFSISCKGNVEEPKEAPGIDQIMERLKDPSDDYVLVAAHRGDWRNAPENSLSAIKNCISMGVDIVEIDVHMTKDSALVLMHDAKIDRTTTGKGKVSDWSLDSLRTLNLKNGCGIPTREKIPTLEEAMLVAKGKILVNLDKCWEYMNVAFKVLERTGTVNQVIFKGSNDVAALRRQYGDLLDKIIYMPIITEKTPDPFAYIEEFLATYRPLAFEVSYSRDDSPVFDVIQSVKKRNSRIWVNTLWESLCGPHDDDRAVDDPEASWGWVINHGANIIQTDRPALLLDYLRAKKLHN
ncbi:MAG: glycerophosphodiester phosphodiesterase family protein [Mangrovibacterium sp.]